MVFLSKGENLRGSHSYLPIKELFFFFLVMSETSSWPVMSIVKMEDGCVSAGPLLSRASFPRPAHSLAFLCHILSPVLSFSSFSYS